MPNLHQEELWVLYNKNSDNMSYSLATNSMEAWDAHIERAYSCNHDEHPEKYAKTKAFLKEQGWVAKHCIVIVD